MNKKNIYKGDLSDNTVKNEENSPDNKEEQFEHGKHPNSLKALEKHQFTKGITGNAGGRPTKFEKLGKELKQLQNIKKDKLYDLFDDDLTAKELVLRKIWRLAVGGDEKMINLLANLDCLND
tara:strand:+ start:853 stop:1218 length:366 start_codon:yes stop_codon:yes gene_type:complete